MDSQIDNEPLILSGYIFLNYTKCMMSSKGSLQILQHEGNRTIMNVESGKFIDVKSCEVRDVEPDQINDVESDKIRDVESVEMVY